MNTRAVLRHDLPASLVVFLVAVPLSLGIALASGAPIVAGLIAAIVGGVVAGALGGSALQVSGPAAGLTVVMAETINTFGWATTCAITVAAGALQLLLGASRIARGALAISPAIVHGMLAGIGVTIVLGQLHVVLGGTAQSSAIDNILELPAQVIAHHDSATLIGLLTIAVLLLWPRLPAAVRKVPGPLAAIALATLLSVVSGMTLPRVELPGDLLSIRFVPQLPDSGWTGFAVAVVTIALIASVESLLSAVAIDKLHTGARSNLDRELLGQGAANMVSGALGGLPVTGVIVRSSTNVNAGAKTRASAILHGVWVLVFVVLLAGLIQNIPLAALAGLLVHVGAKLVNPAHIRQVFKHGDLAVYLVTLLGVVVFDLLTGVLLGIGLALVLMLRRTVWSGIHAHRDGDQWRVVVEGVLTFLSVPRLSKVLGAVPEGTTVTLELVVDYLDHAAFDSLTSWQQAYERAGGTVVVDEVGHPWFATGKSAKPTLSRNAASRAVPRRLAPWSDWQAVDVGLPSQRGGPTRRGATEFQRRTAALVQPTLSELAGGQKPHTLFITCGDSRIVPNLITTSGPGDLFTIRNIGNLVPAGQADPSIGAAIEFAVGVLAVREVVICGHSGCGAMSALAHGAPANTPQLAAWLEHAAPSARRTEEVSLDGQAPPREIDRLALHNVMQQLANLRDYPLVADAERRGELHLTGMYFDVGGAQVYLSEPGSGVFAPVDSDNFSAREHAGDNRDRNRGRQDDHHGGDSGAGAVAAAPGGRVEARADRGTPG
ncbi:bifunctional SulP family inorganic anion transporter/carbonic anhydrase [Amycolatopsis sp. H20-H5]|uniref:bifunctional SulP family inorganic anion transporter/carbonic anhydrase n=1 Tax=Amycolatopsis sp. H20-H5 TaxID=3046309 RepID=UPI002DB99EBB|nr:bifunctional SulP family inorganic anion transporter/carbonic anhydrase [Amycolatopsis sp. H20-H5]MEC3978352.1 bifunctional SulP family inorganic anion transporter/carbonic anhydrase [Amycolatopsis sp. H20-H5]